MKQKISKHGAGLVLAVISLAIVLSVSGEVIYGPLQHDRDTHNDQTRFSEANAKKKQVFDQLISSVGVPMRTEEKNICYNSEQGPFDNGRL